MSPTSYRHSALTPRAFAIGLFTLATVSLQAQSKPNDWPFPSRSPAGAALSSSPTPTPDSTAPPFDVPLSQESWERLPNHQISRAGEEALALRPQQWRHGETENFILHYRGMGDALQIAREIEFDLWYVAQSLGATKDQYTRKSHVYVFADEKEWENFVEAIHAPDWTHSLAIGDALFLNVKAAGGGFDSQTLAHETTHAVVARIYGRRRWPVWLNEGFAEYMGAASVAARHWRSPRSNQRKLAFADMTVAELVATTRYPADLNAVASLYETSAKFVRYLYNKYPQELFPKFVDRILEGRIAEMALREVYGDEFLDMAEFEKHFQNFTR